MARRRVPPGKGDMAKFVVPEKIVIGPGCLAELGRGGERSGGVAGDGGYGPVVGAGERVSAKDHGSTGRGSR